jgi:alpha-L-fucosidase 2
MRLQNTFGLFLVAAAALSLSARAADNGPNLIYDKPAGKWTEALPIGNGRIGAMIFGGTEDERLQVNEGTLWGGGPHDYTNPEAYSHLEEIRRLIFAGKVDEAETLSATMMGKPKLLMPYQPFCDIQLHFAGHGQTTQYHRELHLSDAIAETAYQVGSIGFRRETFISYPDQVLVVRLTASQPGQLTLSASLNSPQPGTSTESTANNTLQLTGHIQPRE